MDEKRLGLRQRVYRAAHIVFNERRAAIDCVVHDVSERGARLRVATPVGIPGEFDLAFDHDGTVRPCHVVWRKEKQIGIAFR